jgi:hypothetical protein
MSYRHSFHFSFSKYLCRYHSVLDTEVALKAGHTRSLSSWSKRNSGRKIIDKSKMQQSEHLCTPTTFAHIDGSNLECSSKFWGSVFNKDLGLQYGVLGTSFRKR